jgi:hypothetical protein
LDIIITVSSSLSILGCGILIILFAVLGRYQTFRFRLIMYLSLCDFLSGISFIMGAYLVEPRDMTPIEEVKQIFLRIFFILKFFPFDYTNKNSFRLEHVLFCSVFAAIFNSRIFSLDGLYRIDSLFHM